MKKQRHPVPQMRRDNFMLQDGKWDYRADEKNEGEALGWGGGFSAQQTILVPYACESAASGVGCECAPRNIWYARKVHIAQETLAGSVRLCFEGVDYTAKVWVNGTFVGRHDGAYTAFDFEISAVLHAGENLIVVKAEDGYRLENPRGKQRWLDRNYSCWYVPTTGIWKSVWLEFTGKYRIGRVKWTPDVIGQKLHAELFLEDFTDGLSVELVVSREGTERARVCVAAQSRHIDVCIGLESPHEEFQVRHWTPDDPALYDVQATLFYNGAAEDVVRSDFGFREFRRERGALTLNGAPVYQKLVLYQGYWAETGMTPPSDEAIEKDLADIKRMGFNGLRVHQKIESEYFLSCADRMGLYVWCEMPSPHAFNDDMKERFLAEWAEIVRQKYNHPSVVVWVPFNESWGIRGVRLDESMQRFADAAYCLTKSYDPVRPVITNDGWEHIMTDIVTVHNYEQDPDRLHLAYCDRETALGEREAPRYQKLIFAEGYRYRGQPVIVSEYGGIAFMNGLSGEDWGYSAVATEDDFCTRFRALRDAIAGIGYICGYCYTQFSDVWQEKNGLVTMDRKYKVDPVKIRKINEEMPEP